MADFASIGSLAVALVSFCLSLTSLLIHYAKRHENPVTAHLEQAIQALQLGQADIIDRVDHWTRRDRTRRLRADQAEEAPPMVEGKDALRQKARNLGVLR
jgi:hypothetical protein